MYLQLLCVILLVKVQVSSSFRNTKLYFSEKQNTIDPFNPLEFVISFQTTYEIAVGEIIYIQLPHFTRKLTPNLRDFNNSYLEIPLGSLVVSPSLYFNAGWEEGLYYFSNSTMYAASRIKLTPRESTAVPTYTEIQLKIYKGNGIGVICGFPSSDDYANAYKNTDDVFQITSNVWAIIWPISTFSSFGIGCSEYGKCNDHGRCDYCRQKCICDQGFGSDLDLMMAKTSIDATCVQRVCPSGKAILDLPNVDGTAHQRQAECSNAGVCDRSTGECKCFSPYFGATCDKLGCPNDCSGHGTCMSMRNIQDYYGEIWKGYKDYRYGLSTIGSVTWDADVVHGCVCYSSWKFGYGLHEYQLGEYFGADCSQRRCPSGDDPITGHDEQNCHRKYQTGAAGGSTHRGVVGNYCHISCSNRGTCDHSTGTCTCYEGFYGDNCGLIANQGMKLFKRNIPLEGDLGSAFE